MKSKVSLFVLSFLVLIPFFEFFHPIDVNYPTLLTIVLFTGYLFVNKLSIKISMSTFFLLYYTFNVLILRGFGGNIDFHHMRYLLLFPLSSYFAYHIALQLKWDVLTALIKIMIVWAVINSVYAFIQVITQTYYSSLQLDILNKTEYVWNKRNYFRLISNFYIKYPGLGFYKTVMSLGHYLIIVFPISLYKYKTGKKNYYLFTSIIIFLGIIICFSRGSLIAIFLTVILMVYKEVDSKNKWYKFLIKIVIPIVLIVVVFNFVSIIYEYIIENQANFTGRVYRWSTIINYSFKNPIKLFFGYGAFYFRDVVFPKLQLTSNIHNAWLQVFLELGIVGFVLFVSSIYKIFMLRLTSKMMYLNYSIIAFIISQIFDHTFFGFHGVIVFMLIGIIEKLIKSNERRVHETSNNNSNL